MIGAAGLSFAFVLSAPLARAATFASERTGKALSPWVSIAPDGTITIMSAATEMGQGSMTSLPLIIAEELDADWSKVRVLPAPPIDAIYGNPGFGGMMYTAGSNAVRSYYRPMRTFGAQVRRVLLENAAKHWNVPVAELTTEPSLVVHAKAVKGVIKIVKLPYGVGVLAETPWATFDARTALIDAVTWSKTGKAWGFDSEQGLQALGVTARNLDAQAAEWFKAGDAKAELS